MSRLLTVLLAAWLAFWPAAALAQFDGGPGSRPRAGSTGNARLRGYSVALVLLSSQTLTVAASSVSFPNIPPGYQDLVLVQVARGDCAGTLNTIIKLQFNGDAGSNYASQRIGANGATAPFADQTTAQTSARVSEMNCAGTAASYPSAAVVEIPNYASTAFNKVALAHYQSFFNGSTTAQLFDFSIADLWGSTAAVNQITLTPTSGNFAINSTFQLYGRGLRP